MSAIRKISDLGDGMTIFVCNEAFVDAFKLIENWTVRAVAATEIAGTRGDLYIFLDLVPPADLIERAVAVDYKSSSVFRSVSDWIRSNQRDFLEAPAVRRFCESPDPQKWQLLVFVIEDASPDTLLMRVISLALLSLG